VGNAGCVIAEDIPSHGQPARGRVTLPPLGVVILKPE
jgi:1,4-alpha-glucan branching enzyme